MYEAAGFSYDSSEAEPAIAIIGAFCLRHLHTSKLTCRGLENPTARADYFLRICKSVPQHAQLIAPIDVRTLFQLYPVLGRWEWEPGLFEDVMAHWMS